MSNMTKTILSTRFIRSAFYLVLLWLLTPSVQAALVNGVILDIDGDQGSELEVTTGFFVEVPTYQIVEGIRIGETQLASNSHGGMADGTENPSIDIWHFAGNTGMHYTRSPTNILSASGNTASIDFSGWTWAYNGVEQIDLGQGAWGGNPDGVARIVCDLDCSVGERFSLFYTATFIDGDPAGFGNVRYRYDVTGTIAAVPVPAAFWLFMSGIMGLTIFRRYA